jgi:hypothetical protein
MPYISLRILGIMVDNVDIINNRRSQAANSTPDVTSQLIPVTHASSDDLESLFYIFFEFVARYGGARGVTAETWSTMPWSQTYENLGHSDGLGAAYLAKGGAIANDKWWSKRVSDYFAKVKPIIEEWRGLISDGLNGTKGGITHDHICEMFERFISTFDDESPLLPSPSLAPEPPSSHTTTVSPTVQSSLQPTEGSDPSTLPALRYSLRLKEKSK